MGDNFSQLSDDKSIVTRFEIIPFDKVVTKMDGMWESKFFVDEADRQSAINTVVNIVIRYKKAQHQGIIPQTVWSNTAKTKSILQSQKPKEESYFDKQRIVRKEGSKISLTDIKKDFESYVGYSVAEQALGYLLKNHGMVKNNSNGQTWFKGYALGGNVGNSSVIEGGMERQW